MLLLCHQICELWRCCALLGLHTCLSLCALASLQTWCWDAFLLRSVAYIDLFVWLLDVLFVKDWYLHLFLAVWEFFLFFAHSPLTIKPRSLPWVTDLVLSRTFPVSEIFEMHHFVCRECQNHYCLLLFLRFHLAFWRRNTAVSCCLWKRGILIWQKRSEELLSHWLSCWRCGLLMKELYVKIIVGQIIMWRLIYDVGSVWWLLLLKVLRFILQVRGHSSWDLRRRSCKDEANVP